MPATPSLDSVVSWIDAYLKIRELPDHDGAVNGLQVENGGSITRVLAAVDASIDSIAAAGRQRGTLLLVHHGLFWGAERSVTGRRYRRLKTALDGDVAVYSAHLPLDAHPEVGNNILLAQLLGLAVSGPFGRYNDLDVGPIDWSLHVPRVGRLRHSLPAGHRPCDRRASHCPRDPSACWRGCCRE